MGPGHGNCYALRVDHSFSGVCDWLNRNSIGGFCVREVSAGNATFRPSQAQEAGSSSASATGAVNEHWHFLLWSDKTVKQLRNSLLHAVPSLKGNGSYSLTLCRDVEKYTRYMCKGESEGAGCEVAWSMGIQYTDEYFEQHHMDYWVENRKMKKRALSSSLIDTVVDQCKQLRVEWTNRSKISELYLREVTARGKPLNTFTGKSAVNSIQVQLCPDDQALLEFASQL